MTDLNQVVMIGRITRDVEVTYTQKGVAIGNFCLAVNESVKKNDEWQDETSFIECAVLGKLCESRAQYLVKGQQCLISGSLKQDRWEYNGKKYSRMRVVVHTVQIVGAKKNGENHSFNTDATSGNPPINADAGSYDAKMPNDNELGYNEDIPF